MLYEEPRMEIYGTEDLPYTDLIDISGESPEYPYGKKTFG